MCIYLFIFFADERPDVVINGTNNGDPVIYGGPVILECIPRTGIPLPTVTWAREPAGAIVSRRGNGTILRVDRVTEDFCVDCLGNSVAGTDTETECVDVLSKSILVNDVFFFTTQPLCFMKFFKVLFLLENTFKVFPNNFFLNIFPSRMTQLFFFKETQIGEGFYTHTHTHARARARMHSRTHTTVRKKTETETKLSICPGPMGLTNPVAEKREEKKKKKRNANKVPQSAVSGLLLYCCNGYFSTALANMFRSAVTKKRVSVSPFVVAVEVLKLKKKTSVLLSSEKRQFLLISVIIIIVVHILPLLHSHVNMPVWTFYACFSEVPPDVKITKPENDNFPVNEGGSVELVCVPQVGVPLPTLTWAASDGSELPTNTISQRGNSSVLRISSVNADICIDCVGTNALGTDRDQRCIDVLSK